VGSAVVRNRAKRLLREAWRDLLDSVPAGHDYVLAARPGFAEPAETRGREWLVAEISRVLGKVRP
jgi:ribonuclease P protein component